MPRTQKSSETPAASGRKGAVPSGKTVSSEKKSARKGASAIKAAKPTKALPTVKTVKTVKKASPAPKKPAAVSRKTAAAAKGAAASTAKPAAASTAKPAAASTAKPAAASTAKPAAASTARPAAASTAKPAAASTSKPAAASTAKPAKKHTAARVSGRSPAPQPAARAPQKRVAETDDKPRAAFLAEQRTLLLKERDSYTRQAEELKAEADSLALEHEPGDVQFDEEGGEGGTSNVDRELDLVLSAQARGAIAEIDRALAKINAGTYGTCEQCGNAIPQARLKALPYAALCVACKSGGLSRR